MSIKSKDKTCAERIEDELQSRAEHFEELFNSVEDTEKSDEAYDELNNIALEISVYKTVKILMSTGGPADWIEVKLDEDNDISGMTYHFADWFDHASTKISKDSYLWDYAEYAMQSINL